MEGLLAAQHMVYQSHITDLSAKLEYVIEHYIPTKTITFPDGDTWDMRNASQISLMQADGFPD